MLGDTKDQSLGLTTILEFAPIRGEDALAGAASARAVVTSPAA